MGVRGAWVKVTASSRAAVSGMVSAMDISLSLGLG